MIEREFSHILDGFYPQLQFQVLIPIKFSVKSGNRVLCWQFATTLDLSLWNIWSGHSRIEFKRLNIASKSLRVIHNLKTIVLNMESLPEYDAILHV